MVEYNEKELEQISEVLTLMNWWKGKLHEIEDRRKVNEEYPWNEAKHLDTRFADAAWLLSNSMEELLEKHPVPESWYEEEDK